MDVCSPRNLLTLLLRLTSFILLGMVRIVQMQQLCDNTIYGVRRVNGSDPGDIFTHPTTPCAQHSCSCPSHLSAFRDDTGEDFGRKQCTCRCNSDRQTFAFDRCMSRPDFYQNMNLDICQVHIFLGTSTSTQIQLMELPQGQDGFLSLELELTPIHPRCEVLNEYFYQTNQNWTTLSALQHRDSHFFSIARVKQKSFLKFHGSPLEVMRSCFSGLIIGLTITCDGPNADIGCLAFKLNGTLSYDPSTGIAPCPQDSTTISSGSTSSGRNDAGMMKRHGNSTPAIVGGVCGAAVIFIIGGVAVFMLWRRKFRHNSPYTGKGNNRGVTMSSLQNGHPHPTEGTVDNEIYAGDDAGIVDNVIYEGGVGADGVFSNPGYADKTPQFKPRMDAPGAFVQPNPGATDKTPTPQRNIIIDEPQYAQIVDDQYADPQKVRDRKDKKNKKKAAKDENYSDLKGPHEQKPDANNSNSNHVYQGLNKGTDYQSLRGPREHHQVRPSQEPKTSQDGHDYTSLTPGSSRPSAGTLSKEADYTVLEGPDSPGEESAAGPDYTTLDGPDSPGDESTSGPDYTVLDGPDSPGD